MQELPVTEALTVTEGAKVPDMPAAASEGAEGAVPRLDTKLVFSCWRCGQTLRELPGEAHIVWDQVQCPGCGSLNALDYAFPRARVEVV